MTVNEFINYISVTIEEIFKGLGTGIIEVLRIAFFQQSFFESNLLPAGFALLIWFAVASWIWQGIDHISKYVSDPEYRAEVQEKKEKEKKIQKATEKLPEKGGVAKIFGWLFLIYIGVLFVVLIITILVELNTYPPRSRRHGGLHQ